MKCNNILLIADSYVTLKYNNKYYKLSLDESIISNGVLIDLEKFTNEYIKFIKQNNIFKIFSNKDLKVIHNVFYFGDLLKNLYNSFKEMGYREIVLVNEKMFFKLDKETCYLLNGNLIRLFYIDEFNSKRILILDQKEFDSSELSFLIKHRVKNKSLIIIGKPEEKYIYKALNYYYYENFDEFFLENYF